MTIRSQRLLALALTGSIAAPTAAMAEWTAPQTLCASCGVGASGALAAPPAGGAGAAWITGPGDEVVAHAAPAAPFGAPTSLTLAGRAIGVSVASAEDGRMVAAWEIDEGLRVSVRPPGGDWDEPVSFGPGEVAMGADGTAYAAVAAGSIVDPRLLLAERPPGGEWSVQEVPIGPTQFVLEPRIAVGGDTVVVAWRGEPPGRDLLVYTARRVAGAWSPVLELPTSSALSPVPDLAVDHRGGAHAVWSATESRQAPGRVFATYWQPGASVWKRARRLAEPEATAGSDPTVAVDHAGNAVAVWRPARPADAAIALARRPAATGRWERPVGIGAGTARPGGPALAIGAAGDLLVAWQERQAPRRVALRAVRGSSLTGQLGRVETVHGPGAPVRIAPTLPERSVAVGVDRAGRTRALWHQPADSPAGLRSSAILAARGTPGDPGDLALSAAQLRINQRISQAAVRRTNAALAALARGLPGAALRHGAFGREAFGPGIAVGGVPTGAIVDSATSYRVPVRVPESRDADRIALSARQLRINQRISQAAVRRANALAARLADGLAGRDLAAGAVGPAHLRPGLSAVLSGAPPAPPPPPITVPAAAEGSGGAVRLSRAQLLTNQRISQAAVRRANAAIAVLESGLGEADFRPAAIGPRELG